MVRGPDHGRGDGLVTARSLAGSRANKHRPVARRTLLSDRLTELVTNTVAVEVRALWRQPWLRPQRWRHPAVTGHGCKPDHAARAVDIEACFPNPPALAGARPCHPGLETKTPPMNAKGTTVRSAAYHRQNGTVRLTPRQLRRMVKKYQRETGTPA
jgi:hypothetical protein